MLLFAIAIGLTSTVFWLFTDPNAVKDHPNTPQAATVETSGDAPIEDLTQPATVGAGDPTDLTDMFLETLGLYWEGFTYDQAAALVGATYEACDYVSGKREYTPLDIKTLDELSESADETLAGSVDPRSQLTRLALLKRDRYRFFDVIRELQSAQQSDVLTLQHSLLACDNPFNNEACGERLTWVNQLTALDADNSESWALAAGIYASADRQEQALSAMQQAASAPNTREIFPQTVRAVFYGLDAATSFDDRARVDAAFRTASTLNPSRHFRECSRRRTEGDLAWVAACNQYFEVLLERPINRITENIAREFLNLPRETNETRPTFDVENPVLTNLIESEWLNRTQGQFTPDILVDYTIPANETLLNAYLDYWMEHGETRAYSWIVSGIVAVLTQDPVLAEQCTAP
ncbi:MAG: hypothetical protein AAFR91_08695 [Pseudomonadota bacterium]